MYWRSLLNSASFTLSLQRWLMIRSSLNDSANVGISKEGKLVAEINDSQAAKYFFTWLVHCNLIQPVSADNYTELPRHTLSV